MKWAKFSIRFGVPPMQTNCSNKKEKEKKKTLMKMCFYFFQFAFLFVISINIFRYLSSPLLSFLFSDDFFFLFFRFAQYFWKDFVTSCMYLYVYRLCLLTLTSPNISTKSWLPLPKAKWYKISWSISSICGLRSLTVPSGYLKTINRCI